LCGLRLEVLRPFVQPLGGLGPPPPLPARLPLPVAERLPTPQRALTKGPGWPVRQAVLFEVAQACLPGLRALPVAIPEASACLLAPGVRPNHHPQTMPRCLQAGRSGHAIDPDIAIALTRAVALGPRRPFVVPPLLQPAPGGRGYPRRIGAQEGV
jgi:hypothetical protein